VDVVLGVLVCVTVVVVVEADVVVVELELEELEDEEQSLAASCLSLTAPSPRLWTSLLLTGEVRLPTAEVNLLAALFAAAQLPELTAADTASSWLARVLLWSPESRSFEPPQATAKAAANPRPPARNARERNPIRRLTLEAGAVCLRLRGYCP
jgi:hypothetical protein